MTVKALTGQDAARPARCRRPPRSTRPGCGSGLLTLIAECCRHDRRTVRASRVGRPAGSSEQDSGGDHLVLVALLYLVLLIALIGWWRARESTLSLRGIDSVAREAFFWAASLAASALGTAIAHLSGDFSGALVPAGLGGLCTWVTLTGCIAVTWWRFGLSRSWRSGPAAS